MYAFYGRCGKPAQGLILIIGEGETKLRRDKLDTLKLGGVGDFSIGKQNGSGKCFKYSDVAFLK